MECKRDGCDNLLIGKQRSWCSTECQKYESRRQYVQANYNISLEQYQTILDYQGGVCAICGRPPKGGKKLAIDHEHLEGGRGPIRGLLCFLCNRRIIGARSTTTILRMYEYVSNPPAQAALGCVVLATGKKRRSRAPRKRMNGRE